MNFRGSMKPLPKVRWTIILLLNTLNIVANKCLFVLSSKSDHSRKFSTSDDLIE